MVRAKLAYRWNSLDPRWPQSLPVTFGPFTLDRSPNLEYLLWDEGLLHVEAGTEPRPNWDYPLSPEYIETEVQQLEEVSPEETADDLLERLEAMFRLFQEGEVYLRRHERMWSGDTGEPVPVSLIMEPFRPVKSEPSVLYVRPAYAMDDQKVQQFVSFFDLYWDIVRSDESRLHTAIHRFSSSYESRTLGDRLVDLVVALEALFGDKGADSLTYKMALRCAA